MITDNSFGYLKANTVLFSQKVCEALGDMCNVQFLPLKESINERPFASPYNVVMFSSFTGAIQGNYVLSFDEGVALRLTGVHEAQLDTKQTSDMRDNYSDLLKETLNLAVGQSIGELEKSFSNISFSPCTIVYGEIQFPNIMSCSIGIEGREGTILCGFLLNLANLKIGEKFEDALHELERQTVIAEERRRNIESILELLPTGLATIDSQGTIIRNPETVLVPLQDINTVQKHLLEIEKKGLQNGINYDIRNEIQDIGKQVANLRRVCLSFFQPVFGSLLEKACSKTGKKAELSITNDVRIDITIMRELYQCLIFLINNAIDHGIEEPGERLQKNKIETGIITIRGEEINERTEIVISDDGRGIDYDALRSQLVTGCHYPENDIAAMSSGELLKFLLEPGISLKASIPGHETGINFVKKVIIGLGGSITIESASGTGTSIVLSLPLK